MFGFACSSPNATSCSATSCGARSSRLPHEPALDVQWLQIAPSDPSENDPLDPFDGAVIGTYQIKAPAAKPLGVVGEVCGDYERCSPQQDSIGPWFRKLPAVRPQDREVLRQHHNRHISEFSDFRLSVLEDDPNVARKSVGLFWDARSGQWILGRFKKNSVSSRTCSLLDQIKTLAAAERIGGGSRKNENPWNANRWRWSLFDECSSDGSAYGLAMKTSLKPQPIIDKPFAIKAPHSHHFPSKVSGEYKDMGALFHGRPCYIRIHESKEGDEEEASRKASKEAERQASEPAEVRFKTVLEKADMEKLRNRFRPSPPKSSSAAIVQPRAQKAVWGDASWSQNRARERSNSASSSDEASANSRANEVPELKIVRTRLIKETQNENSYPWIVETGSHGFSKIIVNFPVPRWNDAGMEFEDLSDLNEAQLRLRAEQELRKDEEWNQRLHANKHLIIRAQARWRGAVARAQQKLLLQNSTSSDNVYLYWVEACACWAISGTLGSCDQRHWIACTSGRLWLLSNPWEVQGEKGGPSWVVISLVPGAAPLRGIRVSDPFATRARQDDWHKASQKHRGYAASGPPLPEPVAAPVRKPVWPEPFYSPEIEVVMSELELEGPLPKPSAPMKFSAHPEECGECADFLPPDYDANYSARFSYALIGAEDIKRAAEEMLQKENDEGQRKNQVKL